MFSQDIQELKKIWFEKVHLTQDEWDQLITYTAAVFNNAGNYLSFGDSKFVPQISKDKFHAVLRNWENYYDYKEIIENLWELISLEVYAENTPYSKIGYYEDGKASAYYSSNLTKSEIELVNRFLKCEPTIQDIIAPLNTRLVKSTDGTLELRINSSNMILGSLIPTSYQFEGTDITLIFGDLNFIAERVVYYLKLAKFYASNKREKRMIEFQIKHFTSGCVGEFKSAMTEWVLNKNPIIETQIGFHERYLDPSAIRAEYQSFWTISDKEGSKILSNLIENSSLIVEHFPWPKEFEKDSYAKANFTSLHIVTYAGSRVFQGQLLPNFDDVRAKHGFKNYSFKNSLNITTKQNIQYVKQNEKELIWKYFRDSLEMNIALHELFGHGSGKLLMQWCETGEFNFDSENLINPLTGEKICSW